MTVDKEVIEFRRDDLSAAIAALDAVIARGDGWVNIEPVMDDDVLEALRRDAPPAVVRLFSGRGAKIPFGTFVAATGRKPAQVGLDHGSGPRTVPKLVAAGIAVPEGWRMRQDHGKRGIVFDLPAGADGAAIVAWIVDAATFVAEIELSGWWSAAVFCQT